MMFFLGLFLGTVSAFLGIGGGVFLLSLLPRMYELTAYETIILSLCFVFFSMVVNTIIYSFQKRVVWNFVLRMGPLTVLGGFLGSKIAAIIPDIYLRMFLIFFLYSLSYGFFKALLDKPNNQTKKSLLSRIPPSGLGVFAGILSGIAGIGSGVFLNFLVLKDDRIQSQEEVPTVNAIMVFICGGVFASVLVNTPHFFGVFYDKVGLNSFLMIFAGILVGAFTGNYFNMNRFPKLRLSLLFSITFVLAFTVVYEVVMKLQNPVS